MGEQPRLLPWSGPEGKPCYLFTDDSDGFLSRMADDMETMQLRMAEEIVEFAGEARADGSLGEVELRFLVARMAESLRDACRIAHSRGRRDCDTRPSPA